MQTRELIGPVADHAQEEAARQEITHGVGGPRVAVAGLEAALVQPAGDLPVRLAGDAAREDRAHRLSLGRLHERRVARLGRPVPKRDGPNGEPPLGALALALGDVEAELVREELRDAFIVFAVVDFAILFLVWSNVPG